MFLVISSRPCSADRPRHILVAEQGLEIAARQHELLTESLQVDERRAQVVRDAVDEHLVLLLLLFEAGGHFVKGAIDLGDLVASGQWRHEGLSVARTPAALPFNTASRLITAWRKRRDRINIVLRNAMPPPINVHM